MPSSGGAKRPLMHLDGYMRSGGHTEWCRLSAGPCRCYDPEPDRLQGQQDVPCGRHESHDAHIHRYPEDPTPYYCDGTWRKLAVAAQFQELFRCMKTSPATFRPELFRTPER